MCGRVSSDICDEDCEGLFNDLNHIIGIDGKNVGLSPEWKKKWVEKISVMLFGSIENALVYFNHQNKEVFTSDSLSTFSHFKEDSTTGNQFNEDVKLNEKILKTLTFPSFYRLS